MVGGADKSRIARESVVDPLRGSQATKRRLFLVLNAGLAVVWTGLAISDGSATHIVFAVAWWMLTVGRVFSDR